MQADGSLERSKGGLGLGLAIVKSVVELHGGTVSAHSEGPGRGTEFVIRVPVEAEAVLPLETTRARSQRPTSRRVLIIEDNVDAANSPRDVLELSRHQVEVAFSGPDGIEKARLFAPDIVFCDIGLPGMDGYEVARTLRADSQLASTPLVALTGYAQPQDQERAADVGFTEHLSKPLNMDQIEALLRVLPKCPA